MKRLLSYEEALAKAAAYCSSAEKCKEDVLSKLKTWNANSNDFAKIIDTLIDEKFIDETRYATAFTNDKFKYNKWGKFKIYAMLRSKKIEEAAIEEAINHIDEEEYERMLYEILTKKLNNISYETEYEKEGKLIKYAMSKGYESKVINKILKTVVK